MGAAGLVDAHADGASGSTASFDYGDASAADVQPVAAGSADSSHTYAANGTFTIAVTSGESTPGSTDVTIGDLTFDPADYTIPAVMEYVEQHPDERDEIRDAEADGKARSTLLAWLDEG